MSIRSWLVFVLVLALAIVPHPSRAAVSARCPPPRADMLFPGDHVKVVVFDHPELSLGPAAIPADQILTLPIVGAFRTANTPVAILDRRVEGTLAQAIVSPSVDIQLIARSDTASVTGSTTAAIALTPGLTLGAALAGVKFTDAADLTHVTVTHAGALAACGPYDASPEPDASRFAALLLYSGDVIHVPNKAAKIQIVGAVKTPLTAYLNPGDPLGSVLQLAQFTDDANVNRLQITNGTAPVSIVSLNAGLTTPASIPGDLILVPYAPHVSMNGDIKKAGQIVVKDDGTLLTAVTLAGGPNKDADLSSISIAHAVPGDCAGEPVAKVDLTGVAQGKASANPTLCNGDVVYVATAKPRLNAVALFAALLVAAKTLKIPK